MLIKTIVILSFMVGIPQEFPEIDKLKNEYNKGDSESKKETLRKILSLSHESGEIPLSEYTKLLALGLSDIDIHIRTISAEYLGIRQYPDVAVPELIKSLKGLDSYLDKMYKEVLPRHKKLIKNNNMATPLFEALIMKATSEDYSTAIIMSLGKYQDIRCQKTLLEYIKGNKAFSKSDWALNKACQVLCEYGTQKCFEEVIKLAGRIDHRIKQENKKKKINKSFISSLNKLNGRIFDNLEIASKSIGIETAESNSVKSWKNWLNLNRKYLPRKLINN